MNLDELFASYIKGKGWSILIVILIIAVIFFVTRNSNIIFVRTADDKKVTIEIMDMCLDSIMDFSTFDYRNVNKEPKYIALHCTASPEGLDLSEFQLREIFKKKYYPYNKMGYNYVVGLKGNVIALAPIDSSAVLEPREVVWGVSGVNSRTISIAYIGGLDRNHKPKDTRTPQQKIVFRYLIFQLKTQFPNVKVMNHRDFPGVHKACPSYDGSKEFNF